jgi:hypothetical protein
LNRTPANSKVYEVLLQSYLQLGDDDLFDWQEQEITEDWKQQSSKYRSLNS